MSSSSPLKTKSSDFGFLRILTEVTTRLDEIRSTEKLLRIALRSAIDTFGAEEGCVASSDRGAPVRLRLSLPPSARWDLEHMEGFRRAERRERQPGTFLAPLERRLRPWGVLALKLPEETLDRAKMRAINRFARVVSSMIQRIDGLRIADVRTRIDHKLMEQLRPKDLFYQILHGLRTLTGYDHSAALLIHKQNPGALEVVAEQIAWRKGRSDRIGLTRTVSADTAALFETDSVFGFDWLDGRWREWQGRAADSVAEVLDYNREEDERAERTILCAPLPSREGTLGVLKVACRRSDSLGEYEAELIREFVPSAAIAIQNLKRTESLEIGMLEAEKKHVMANLARGVSHDINNAVGSVLPLVQQMIDDVRSGHLDPEVLLEDLEQIESSLQVCRRVFDGMLHFNRDSAPNLREADLARAIESTLAILQEGMRRGSVKVELELEEDLRLVRCAQSDLEQLVLNLATNARDAMPTGGRLLVRATAEPSEVVLTIEDTGEGIDPHHLARIQEPFFTTKRHGTGLGLSICRTIVWDVDGQLAIESELGRGTRVTVRLPRASEPSRERA